MVVKTWDMELFSEFLMEKYFYLENKINSDYVLVLESHIFMSTECIVNFLHISKIHRNKRNKYNLMRYAGALL